MFIYNQALKQSALNDVKYIECTYDQFALIVCKLHLKKIIVVLVLISKHLLFNCSVPISLFYGDKCQYLPGCNNCRC